MESERTQWEQRYLEETAMRQVAIDAASIPKDAKIAALEKTSAESEKLIADARNQFFLLSTGFFQSSDFGIFWD